MKKYLIVSGDSFTDKDFRSSCYPDMDVSWPKWPDILAKKLDMKLINLAKAGSGNGYIYNTLLDCIQLVPKDEIGYVIAGWSQCQRGDYQELGHTTGVLGGLKSTQAERDNFHANMKDSWGGQDIYKPTEMGEYAVDKRNWHQDRIDPRGNLPYWVRRTLRHYVGLQMLCENYNIPYMQCQMIDMYKDYIDGMMPTEEEVAFQGKDLYADRQTYPGDAKADEQLIMKIIMSYDGHIDTSRVIGWPLTRTLGGFPINRGVMGWNQIEEEPYVIDENDNHPNAAGHELIAEYIYDWMG